MNIEYSKKKHDLRSDPLVEFLAKAKAFVTAHGKNLTVVVVGAAIVVAGAVLFAQMRAAAQKRADAAFGRALEYYESSDRQKAILELGDVANEYRGTPHAAYAAYLLGMTLIEENRPAEALEWFDVASKGAPGAGFVPAAALEGLSMAYEAQGDYQQALAYAQKALDDKRLAHRHPHLRWRMALLNAQLSNTSQALALCRAIESDTLAMALHQKARNLEAELKAKGS